MGLEISETELLEFAKRVELTATRFLEGHHRSSRHGQGVEFETMLPYSEGDESRHINWKHFAATDRYLVNRFRSQERSSWTVLIDRTESMTYRGKLAWAAEFAAAMIFVARVWGDPWRLLPNENMDLEDAYRSLITRQAGVSNLSTLRQIDSRPSDRLVFLSDFMWEVRELEALIADFEGQFSSIALVQVLDPTERIFDFNQISEFQDMEAPSKMILDPRLARKLYLNALETQRESLRMLSHRHATVYFYEVSLSEPCIDILEELFQDL